MYCEGMYLQCTCSVRMSLMYCVHMYLQCTEPYVAYRYVCAVYLQCRKDCLMNCVEMYLYIPTVYRIMPYVLCRDVPVVYL